ncbi:dihydrodipicolinate synthase family protein [Adhaeretor mobilis]|uniref:Dihydrodipicolinate synthase family protein n=1 Tax=Adhaeretor mobilis TaxID=1930276 RepID=A0A517MPV5_9BACT|nr:dihydrodipicolinate synthase family protein [Adhaeretor mobilis]QDS96911.1 hypothetical protein HG15A2_01700 [Adhaeretor mobilis]
MANSDLSNPSQESQSGPTQQQFRQQLQRGMAIPAHPLALTAERKLDERRQRGLSRYYIDSGAGGLAVGVHTTQFQIHDPKCGLLEPVLALAAEEISRANLSRETPLVPIAGICGPTEQAVQEASLARDLGYRFGLVSLAALKGQTHEQLIDHCRAVSEVIDVFGFYLQPSVGGMDLPFSFWRDFCDIPNVAAIKIAAFNRYSTSEVIRAVTESGREDIALYTGNDDNIVCDLLTEYQFLADGKNVSRRFCGGLLGQWAVWTSLAVRLQAECQQVIDAREGVPHELLATATALTDANAAIFDVAHDFHGCVPGIHEVLRRQGLLEGIWCLDENETLSPGQAKQLDRVMQSYPELSDDAFVAENLDRWLSV